MTKIQQEAIRQHGLNLLDLFPRATEGDPVKLCKKLRKLEGKAAALALRQCNGPEFASEEALESQYEAILHQVNGLLCNRAVPVFINRDPRGYQLKIECGYMQPHVRLHRDWGGYGIIAPEINSKGE